MTAIPWSQLTAAQAKERAEVAAHRASARWALVATMPSTNVRIWSSIVAFFAIMARVVVTRAGLDGKGWEPSEVLLGFLLLWAGLDVAQFWTKRKTDSGYVAQMQGTQVQAQEAPPAPAATSTNLPEIGT